MELQPQQLYTQIFRCGNINFSKRTRCNRCGTPKSTAEHRVSSGSQKQGDWSCDQCGNINWARRSNCNICGVPKQPLNVEPRVGRGGGHYDLQDPTDRNTYDSDQEKYDEFGRKKKGRV
ncbi:zinc finger domain containing protein [Theileria equi strain WA]|uniref:Zinc finger domain containing protein n=1 Tax=Theileria equi strain WA TaxID=1537102 RepID=L1LE71_THEEQ|nr:zinc finger domain containing protein [Theileria equi strain WA]EKX73458.1 zinc finger domain containing protein [Theileria equi strain WA]|eukprot:XP_004832910.1 zinc finger domain containing protein [Theileria equi strain WA]